MTWEELLKKYQICVGRMTNERKINVLKAKGIYVKQITQGNRWHPTEFEIEDDHIFYLDWVKHPTLPRELTRDGLIRDSENKNLYKPQPNSDGYLFCIINDKKYMHHRLLMETFNPCENSDLLVVDHINGRKQDNRLENLRWITNKENLKLRDNNRAEISAFVNQLIQKYGYEKTLFFLKKDLTKYL